jgi:Zn-finger nucleic acid-binding protein
MSDINSAPATFNGRGMLCPVCGVDLLLSERQGIEIDYCPQCRGVWLDRGELDKIVERNAAYEMTGAAGPGYQTSHSQTEPRDRADSHGGSHGRGSRHGEDRHGGGHQAGYRGGGFLDGLFRR